MRRCTPTRGQRSVLRMAFWCRVASARAALRAKYLPPIMRAQTRCPTLASAWACRLRSSSLLATCWDSRTQTPPSSTLRRRTLRSSSCPRAQPRTRVGPCGSAPARRCCRRRIASLRASTSSRTVSSTSATGTGTKSTRSWCPSSRRMACSLWGVTRQGSAWRFWSSQPTPRTIPTLWLRSSTRSSSPDLGSPPRCSLGSSWQLARSWTAS
mmetsp:Transcript_3707/g.10451  ORF Transcript_3707/g.10451 Transcript_3707/m.10451 type:complete len:211 (-) Transcript_3707:534-1166(-)